MRLTATLVTLTMLGALTRSAEAAPTKEQCIDADTEAQSLLAAGAFRAARELLRLCTDPACPNIVREDCTQRLDELAQHQPAIVLAAKDARGADLAKVVVRMDGAILTEKLDGRAIAIDPGEHAFTFEAPGAVLVERRIVIREGERARPLSVSFVDSAPPVLSSAPAPVLAPTPASTVHRSAIALGSAGVVGLGLGTVLGLMASSRWHDAQAACPSSDRCAAAASATSSKSAAEGLATASTVGFVAGGVFLLGGALLYVFAPSSKTHARAPFLLGSF